MLGFQNFGSLRRGRWEGYIPAPPHLQVGSHVAGGILRVPTAGSRIQLHGHMPMGMLTLSLPNFTGGLCAFVDTTTDATCSVTQFSALLSFEAEAALVKECPAAARPLFTLASLFLDSDTSVIIVVASFGGRMERCGRKEACLRRGVPAPSSEGVASRFLSYPCLLGRVPPRNAWRCLYPRRRDLNGVLRLER